MLGGVGDLQDAHLLVPQIRRVKDPAKLLADLLDRDGVVGVDEHRAEQIGRDTRPVLKRTFQEVRGRHHEPSQIPDPHDDEGAADLLDPPPPSLHDHDVIQPDRLGQCDLHARDEVAEQRPRRHPRHETCDARRRRQGGAQGPNARKRHQHGGERHRADDGHGEPAKHQCPGADLSRRKIVPLINPVPGDDDVAQDIKNLRNEPADGPNQRDGHGVTNRIEQERRERQQRQNHEEHRNDEQDSDRPALAANKRFGGRPLSLSGGIPGRGKDHVVAHQGERDRPDDEDDRLQPALPVLCKRRDHSPVPDCRAGPVAVPSASADTYSFAAASGNRNRAVPDLMTALGTGPTAHTSRMACRPRPNRAHSLITQGSGSSRHCRR
jgi:hypothetical protein